MKYIKDKIITSVIYLTLLGCLIYFSIIINDLRLLMTSILVTVIFTATVIIDVYKYINCNTIEFQILLRKPSKTKKYGVYIIKDNNNVEYLIYGITKKEYFSFKENHKYKIKYKKIDNENIIIEIKE